MSEDLSRAKNRAKNATDDDQPEVEAHRARNRAKNAADDGDSSEPDVEAHLFKH